MASGVGESGRAGVAGECAMTMPIDLRYEMYRADEAGGGHPQKMMEALGITYAKAVPQSIADQWMFFDCANLPDPLPPFLSLLKLSESERDWWTQ